MSKVVIADKYKEAFSLFTSRKEYSDIIEFLKIQKNNFAVLEWSHLKSHDKDLAIKKARYEGLVEMIDLFIRVCEESKKGEEE